MKKVFLTLGITSILVMLLQTYSMSGIYAITEESNTTMNIDEKNPSEGAALGVIGNATTAFKFKDIIAEGKSALVKVSDIKPNTPINYITIACLDGSLFNLNSELFEVKCEKIGVIGEGEKITVNNETQYRDTPAVSSSLLTAVSEGIEKRIAACFSYKSFSALAEDSNQIVTVDCDRLYIIYK